MALRVVGGVLSVAFGVAELVTILLADSLDLSAKLVAAPFCIAWIWFGWRWATAHISVTGDRMVMRGIFRTVTVDVSDTVGWKSVPFNRSVLLKIVMSDGSEVKVPLSIQGSIRSQVALQRKLHQLGVARAGLL